MEELLNHAVRSYDAIDRKLCELVFHACESTFYNWNFLNIMDIKNAQSFPMILQLSLRRRFSCTYEQLLHPLQTGKYHLDTERKETLYFNFDQRNDMHFCCSDF